VSWSYNLALAADKDKVRLLIGDTNSADQQLQDEELLFLIAQRGDVNLAAVDACRALHAKYARQVDTTNLSLSVGASKRAEAYKLLAETLETKASSLVGAEMFVGGISIAGKETLDSNTDAVQPNFRMGQDDEPGANSNPLVDPTLGS
jgi:spermidine/putrescine-binding protein